MIRRLKALLSFSSLGVRLGSTIILALMPLGVLSVVQTRDALHQVDASTLKGVGGATLQAMREQIEVIKEAQVSARVLASLVARPTVGEPSCVQQVTSVKREIAQATVVAYVPKSGLVTCSSTGKVHDLSDNAEFRKMLELPQPSLIYDAHGQLSQQAVIGVRHPVLAADGTFIGFVVISLAYNALSAGAYGDSVAMWNPVYFASFTGDGRILVSSEPDLPPDTAIPGNHTFAELAGLSDTSFFVEEGTSRQILSVVTVAPNLFLVSVWRPDSASFLTNVAGPYLMPALTWIAALVAAAFASNRLVVRHVRALARSMTDYVSSRQRLQIPDMDGAPDEIQRLHAAYELMIRTIEQEEAELQNLVVDKDVLIREVSHRSGNSLQIIASIMRMYRREAADQKLRSVLDGLINRVIALSSTHTSLYTLSGQRDVSVDEILANVIKRLKEIHGVALGVASKRLQPVRIDAEAAVPLALALAEAIGCYFSRGGLGTDEVSVSLTESDGTIRLTVEGPEVAELRPHLTEGLVSLPQRMLKQFAAQLSGTVSIRLEDGRATVDLVFPRRNPLRQT
ncbi:MAG: sensor histidine kinase [Rhodobacteraceae bacterium]|nr:sensor histidine kinase [Paracoccaceae bacterium]